MLLRQKQFSDLQTYQGLEFESYQTRQKQQFYHLLQQKFSINEQLSNMLVKQ